MPAGIVAESCDICASLDEQRVPDQLESLCCAPDSRFALCEPGILEPFFALLIEALEAFGSKVLICGIRITPSISMDETVMMGKRGLVH